MRRAICKVLLFLMSVVWLCVYSVPGYAVGKAFDISQIDDSPKIRNIQYPDWFKNSFLDLNEDLNEALEAGKKGIIIYFGQKDCPYCEALVEVNFGSEKDIVRYTKNHFDLIPIDIWGDREVTDFDGQLYTEKKFSEINKSHFTPSLIFYGEGGKQILQLRGYYTPYKMRAALEYVVEGFYQKESLRNYIARAKSPNKDSKTGMNAEEFFVKPPYNLNRTVMPSKSPLIVFFEQGSCHACDVLHSEPLTDEITRILLESFETVQLDMWSDTPVITPDGRKQSAREWANELGLFYAPSILLFDENGKEIIRVGSVVKVYRLRSVLEYVLEKGYEEAATLQRWREMRQMKALSGDTFK